MRRENEHIRKVARVAGVYLWEIASKMQISEPTLMRWLRVPLSPERESEVLKAIEELSKETI